MNTKISPRRWGVAFIITLALALLIAGFQSRALADGVVGEVETDADLRELVYELVVDMDSVHDAESWSIWMDRWYSVAQVQYGTHQADGTLAFGQVVPVPEHPADWGYVDWENVPYEVRPSIALAHACGVMNGRVYQDRNNELQWDVGEYARRSEMANISARLLELMFEVMLSGGAYSHPGCPLAAEAFWGDPDMFKDLIERQADRHAENVDRLEAAIVDLESRVGVDIDAATAAAARADLELRQEFQAGLEEILRDTNARWDELRDEVGSLWIALAEFDHELAELKQEIYEDVVAYCQQSDDCRGPQGPRGPRGLQGPPGQDADLSEFDDMLAELRRGHDDQQAQLDDHERRISALEDRFDVTVDYCPAWVNFTGNRGVGEFDEDNPYRHGMEVSANAGLNADVAASGKVWIVSYHLPGHDPIRPNDRAEWKVSGFYESLRPGAIVAITLSDGEDTCTVSTTLVGL